MRRLSLYLPPELAQRLAVYCARQGIEMSATVSQAVDEFLQREDR